MIPPASAPSSAWFAPLLAPVAGQVAAAWNRIPGGPAHPEAVPRAGLGGALVIHIARAWGTRRWQEEGRVAVTAIEALNQRVHLGEPEAAERAAWFAADLRLVLHLARRAARRDEALLRRVGARCLARGGEGNEPVGESTLFLRAAVAAGVIVGAAPDPVHLALHAWAAAIGDWLDARAAGEADLRVPPAATAALERLPDAAARELLLSLHAPPPAGDPRAFSRWVPLPVPPRAPPDEPFTRAMLATLAGEGALPAAGRWLASGGGKRLRAQIAVAAAVAAGGGDALAVAAEVEWVHAASLVLDDIVDEAELRRGAPPLHRLASTPFAAGVAGWLLAHTALREPGLADAMLALAEGQRAELAHAGEPSLSRQDWYAIAAQKTARLFAAAASLGGRAAGASPAHQQQLARFGQELGLAFQIVDDLLDVVGEADALGKPPGQDLRAGRVGFPMVLLRELEPVPRPGEAPHAAALRLGVPALCLAQAGIHEARAVGALEGLPGDIAGLVHLARASVERRA